MNAIFVKSTNTIMALHESDGKPGDFIFLYTYKGEFIEKCIIYKCPE